MNTTRFECPICHETLLDPRALPCGHDYCGKVNGLDKPCIAYLLRDGVITCEMDNQEFENLKLSDLRTHITLRDTIEDYKRNEGNKCPTHVNNNVDLVCLTCGGEKICTSCLRDHQEHKVISAADHLEKKMAGIDTELEEKTQWLEERLANRDKALEKLTRLTEDVRRDREEISSSLEKLRSLKLQSQQIRERNPPETLYRADTLLWIQALLWIQVDTLLEKNRSVDLKNAVKPENVEETCREVIQLLTDGQPLSYSKINVTPGNEALQRVVEHSSAVAEATIQPPVTNFTSSGEVARVKQAKCWSISCVDDTIFVTTRDHVIKYRWEASGGKFSINEVKRSAIFESVYSRDLAAAKTQDRVRLYVCSNGEKTVERYDPDSLEQLKKINTDQLYSHRIVCIAAWGDMLVISDRHHVIAMYKNDQLVSTVPYEHEVCDIRLSSTFLATWSNDRHIRVMRWNGDRLDPTPVHTIEKDCWELAMSERLVVAVDRYAKKLVMLDLTTMNERLLEGDVGEFWPRSFAKEDLVVGTNRYPNCELTMVQLS